MESEEKIFETVNDFLKLNEIYSTNNCPVSYLSEYQKAIKSLLDLYNKEKEKNNKLTSLIYRIRNELRKLLISYDGEYYRPIKNTTKQEIYKSYFKLRTMLKGEYCFKDNETALKELLEDIEND